jgi:hypothetical protein
VSLWFVTSAHADWQVTPVSSLQKLTAVAPGVLEPFKSDFRFLRATRGEWENFQIVVQAGAQALPHIKVAVANPNSSDNQSIGAENIQLYWENYVYVPQPSGNRRLDKLWWPDALVPPALQKDPSLAPYRTRVLWISVRVPLHADFRIYKDTISLSANGITKNVPFVLSVERVTYSAKEPLSQPTLRANVAVYYDVLREWYAKNVRTLNDAEFATLRKNYYDFLLDYRINAYDLPVDWKSDEAQKYLRDSRVLSIRTPPLERADFNGALVAIKRANALNKAYYYWLDEA